MAGHMHTSLTEALAMTIRNSATRDSIVCFMATTEHGRYTSEEFPAFSTVGGLFGRSAGQDLLRYAWTDNSVAH